MKRYPRFILGTCCIPWKSNFEFDRALFHRALEHVLGHGTRHLYIFGTAGEGHAVSHRQFQEITRAFVEQMADENATPMVGVISLSMEEVIERIAWARNLGVQQFQISLPSWGVCTPAEAFTFFKRICTRFKDCSFLHYNLRRAGRLLQAEEYARLADTFENLVAVKLAGATLEEAIAVQQAAPSLRLFLTEGIFPDACAAGVEPGLLVSVASMNWSLARRFYESCVSRDVAAVSRYRQQLDVLIAMLHEAVAGEAHMDGAFDQMFVKRYIREFPLRLLPPYQAASDAAFDRFIHALKERCPEWLD